MTISDGGQPVSLSSSVQVCLTIRDENDNSPTWDEKSKRAGSVPRLVYYSLTLTIIWVTNSNTNSIIVSCCVKTLG